MLTKSERARYARHLILPEVGEAGQEKLKAGSVLVVGAGGLGSPVGLYLAAAGVGRIGLVDFDDVDASNLHRQVLYGTSDVGKPKVEAAQARLQDLNPDIAIDTHDAALTSENALGIIEKYDVIVDGTDNFATRYLVNDACVLLGKPNVYGSIFRFEGQASVFSAADGPCYRCLYPEPPPPHLVPSCAEGGVLGVLPGVIGTIQATETIKLLTGIGETLVGRLLLFDALRMSFRSLRLKQQHDAHAAITGLIDYDQFCNPANLHEVTRDRRRDRRSTSANSTNGMPATSTARATSRSASFRIASTNCRAMPTSSSTARPAAAPRAPSTSPAMRASRAPSTCAAVTRACADTSYNFPNGNRLHHRRRPRSSSAAHRLRREPLAQRAEVGVRMGGFALGLRARAEAFSGEEAGRVSRPLAALADRDRPSLPRHARVSRAVGRSDFSEPLPLQLRHQSRRRAGGVDRRGRARATG